MLLTPDAELIKPASDQKTRRDNFPRLDVDSVSTVTFST